MSKLAEKQCVECGRMFVPRSGTQVYCDGPHFTNCATCGVQISYTCSPREKPKYCSQDCRTIGKQKTVMRRYGVDNVSRIPAVQKKISIAKGGDGSEYKDVPEWKPFTALRPSTKRICKYCGKEFEGVGTQVYCEGPHYANCIICGEQMEVNPVQPRKCCSDKCKSALRKQSLLSKQRICKECGQPFISLSTVDCYCKRDHFRPCPICGQPVKVKHFYEPARCCSAECTSKLRIATNMKKYGADIPAKSEMICKKLHDAAVSEETQRKRAETSMQRYGVDNPAKANEVRLKISQTVSSPECQERIQQTSMERYGALHAMQSAEGLRRYSDAIQAKYGVPYFVMTDQYREGAGTISMNNQNFAKHLSMHGLECEFEFPLEDRSFDIHILNTNILIEVDPTYTHNAVGNHWGKGLDKNYHRDKSRLAELHGYRCIHVFDWDDWNSVIDLITPKTTIFARKCTLQRIDSYTAKLFLNKHHLQGNCNGQTVIYGLYYDGALVEMMSFGKPRYTKKYQWELLRLCTDTQFKVIGGAAKLFKHFINDYKPESLVSYCDAAKFSGDVYEKLRFKLDHFADPNKIWSHENQKITNNLLLQRGYDQLFNANYGKGTSNEELMIEHEWLPVYDCGQRVFVYVT